MSMNFYVANIVNGEYKIPYSMDSLRAFNETETGAYIGPNHAYCRDLDVGFSDGNAKYLMSKIGIVIKNGMTPDIALNNELIDKIDRQLDLFFQDGEWEDYRRMMRIKTLVLLGIHQYNAEIIYGA